jgi:hypothetical protein
MNRTRWWPRCGPSYQWKLLLLVMILLRLIFFVGNWNQTPMMTGHHEISNDPSYYLTRGEKQDDDFNTTNILEDQFPSSWRPTRQWVEECVDRQTQLGLRPFEIPWRGYTLGDCVLICYKCKISARASHKQSFAAQYRRQACPKGSGVAPSRINNHNHTQIIQWETLEHILSQEDSSFDKPPPNAIVIHLRLGDIIEQANASVVDMLFQGGSPAHSSRYRNSLKSISEYLDTIELLKKSSTITLQVIIRGGVHFHNYYVPSTEKVQAPKSRAYANCLHQALSQNTWKNHHRLNVSMVIEGPTPDEDFYYGSHASYLIVSAGGYSQLLGRMAQRLGGVLSGRTFFY